MRAKFRWELYEAGDGWRWRLRAANGLIIADGAEGYQERRKARAGLIRVALAGTELIAGKGAAVIIEAPPPSSPARRPRDKRRGA